MRHSIPRTKQLPRPEEKSFSTGFPNNSNTCHNNKDNTPSYHPYNTQMRSRRIDYLSTSRKILQSIFPIPGSGDYAQSDHDAVISQLTHSSKQEATPNTYTHHPRKLKMIGRAAEPPSQLAPLGQPRSPGSRCHRSIPQVQIPGKQTAQATPPQADVRADPSGPNSTALEARTGSPQAREEKVGPRAGRQGSARRLERLQAKQAKQRQAPAVPVGTQTHYNHSLATAYDTAL